MSSKPCKFFIGDSDTALDYNQMREFLFKNPEFLKGEAVSGENVRPIDTSEKPVEKTGESVQVNPALASVEATAKEQTPPALRDVESTAKALENTHTDREKLSVLKHVSGTLRQNLVDIAYLLEEQSAENAPIYDKINKIGNSITDDMETMEEGGFSGNFDEVYQRFEGRLNEAKELVESLTPREEFKQVLSLFERVSKKGVSDWIKVNSDQKSNKYHKAKAKPENTRTEQEQELVKAVEELLTPKTQEDEQSTTTTDRGAINQTGAVPQQRGDGGGRRILRSEEALQGAPNVKGFQGPIPELVNAAKRYAEKIGIPYRRQAEYVEADAKLGNRLADAYTKMKHSPNDPKVKEAYAELIRQVKDQYQTLVDAGYEFTFFDDKTDPYDGKPWRAMEDLRSNKKMAVYGTYSGYGTEGITDAQIEDNPMLEDTGLMWPDQLGEMRAVTVNDLFRAVHDAFGHGLEGAGFRARGEENAWQAHVRLFTGPAIAAMTSETRGQNSWLNFGPFAEKNKTASVDSTIFAEQKIGLLPEWAWKEGIAPDVEEELPTKTEPNEPISQQSAAEVPVQPETGISGEVAQGTPQAEPKEAAKQGEEKEVAAPSSLESLAAEMAEEVQKLVKQKKPEQKKKDSEKMAQTSIQFQEEAAAEAKQEPMAEEDAGNMIDDVFSQLSSDEDADIPPSNQNLYIVPPAVARMMQPPPPAPTSIFPKEVQERVDKARKKPKENVFYKFLNKLKYFGNGFSRTNVELSGKKFAKVIDKLRLVKQAPQVALRAANIHMKSILGGLNQTQRAHFQDYILAADLLGSIEDGTYPTDLNWIDVNGDGIGPFGFKNFQEVRDAFAKGEALLAADPVLAAAVKKRDDNINKLFEISKKAGLVSGDQINNGRSYFHRQVLKFMEDGSISDAVMKISARRRKLAQFKKRKGSLKDYYTNFAEIEFGIVANAVFEITKRQYVNDIVNEFKPIHKQMIADAQKKVQDYIDSVEAQFGIGSPEHDLALENRKKFEDEALNELMGDEYELYFPEAKNAFFKTDVVLGTDVEDAITRAASGQVGLALQDLQDALKPIVMIGRGRQMFLPVEVARTFDRLGRVKYDDSGLEIVTDAIEQGTTLFKKSALLNPFRLGKYLFGNFAGDFDKSLATNSKIIVRAGQMAKLYYDIKSGKNDKFFDLAVRLGVVGSGSSAEIGNVSKEEWAKFATTRNPSIEGFLRNVMENMAGVKWSFEKYFELAGKAASWREDIFRLAAFSVALEEVNKGKKFYWFSRKTEIDQITNNEERAAKLAREIFGDYGAVSQTGENLAKYLMPFYRFRETNIRGYKNFIFNNLDSKAGREKIIKYGIRRGVTRAASMAIINSIRLALFTSAVYAWNRLMWPDEEEELRAAGDQSFHIILGRNPDGTINVMRTQGTMNAFMESMGINGIMQFYRDYQNNGATMQDVAKEPAKAFTNEMYQGLSPYIKAPVELLSGKSRFPNVFRPRAIRNTDWNLEYLMGSLALREPYEILSNKPRRDKDFWDMFLTSEMNPKEIAYYQTINKIGEDMGRFRMVYSPGTSMASKAKVERQNALWRWKMNTKFGNTDEAEKDLANYYLLGGKEKDIKQSVRAMNPLNQLSEFQRRAIDYFIEGKEIDFSKKQSIGIAKDKYAIIVGGRQYIVPIEEIDYLLSLSKKDVNMFKMAQEHYNSTFNENGMTKPKKK